jgi:hypothetical protein
MNAHDETVLVRRAQLRIDQAIPEKEIGNMGNARSKGQLRPLSYTDQCSTLGILFQSFEELVESFLVRGSHSDEPHADLAPTVPTHRRPLNVNR